MKRLLALLLAVLVLLSMPVTLVRADGEEPPATETTDPADMTIDPARLLDPAYGAARARAYGAARARPHGASDTRPHGAPGPRSHGGSRPRSHGSARA